jgi:hypothetical protein
MKLEMLLQHKETGQLKKLELQIMTRWKKEYKNRVLARFYKLNDYWEAENLPYTFITFTSRQDMTLTEQYEFIKAKFRKMRDVMRKALGKFDYIWVTEAHRTGFTHIHMMAFTEISEEDEKHFKELWQEKYEAGNKKALDFSRSSDTGSIRSMKNYLMKYITKTLDSLSNPSELLYNAVAWKMARRDNDTSKGFRFYGMSKNLTSICKLDGSEKGIYSCIHQKIVTRDGRKIETRRLGNVELLQQAYTDLYNIFTDKIICLGLLT